MIKWTALSPAILFASASLANAASTLSATDKAFLTHDAQGSSYEMQLSQLAVQKSANAAVQSFAKQDVADHTNLNNMAEQIAQASGMTLPTAPTSDDQQKLDKISKLSGASFDTAYVKAMKSINAEDKSDFAKEAGVTANPQVKSFVEQAQATDQKHARMVDSLSANL